MIDVDEIRKKITAKVIADSISPEGKRLTTMQVTFHRFILAEVNTHRMLTRSSASSRAIPVQRVLDRITATPFFAISWPVEQRGMQGGAELVGSDLLAAQDVLEDIAQYTLERIQAYVEHVPPESRLHKSVLNRPLEWFSDHTALITATEWDNFFALRCNRLAQPEFRVVAELMEEALEQSVPERVQFGAWHTPYVDWAAKEELLDAGLDPKAVSVGRCCRVSYLTQEGKRDPWEDVNLCDRLLHPEEGPPHASPFEHVATPAREGENVLGNFHGWHQYRHLVTDF